MIGDKTFQVDSIPLAIVSRLEVLNRAIEEVEKQNGLDDEEIKRLRETINKVLARMSARDDAVEWSRAERDHLAFAVKAYQDEKPPEPAGSAWNEFLASPPVHEYVGTDVPRKVVEHRKTPERNGVVRDKLTMREALIDVLAEAKGSLTADELRKLIERVRIVGTTHTVSARMSELTRDGLAVRVKMGTYIAAPAIEIVQKAVAAE
jgi:hypothetical protein